MWCCIYLCHGPVSLLQAALSHLQTSYEFKGVCHLDTHVTKGGFFGCEGGSLDVQTFLQWTTGDWYLVGTFTSEYNSDNYKFWGSSQGSNIPKVKHANWFVEELTIAMVQRQLESCPKARATCCNRP